MCTSASIENRTPPTSSPSTSPARRSSRYDLAPRRPTTSAWWPIAWLARAWPTWPGTPTPASPPAPVLRRRLTRKTARYLEDRRRLFDPLTRTLGLLAVRRLAAVTDARRGRPRDPGGRSRWRRRFRRARRSTGTSAPTGPDAVLVSDVVKHASGQVEYLKSARRLGIPAATCVASWDNLTNKGLLKYVPERVFVWNEIQRREAVELHGMPGRARGRDRRAAARQVVRAGPGDAARGVRQQHRTRSRRARTSLYLCSSPFVSNHHAEGESSS